MDTRYIVLKADPTTLLGGRLRSPRGGQWENRTNTTVVLTPASRHAAHDSYAMPRSTRDGRAPEGGRRWRRRVRAARSVVRHPAGEGRARTPWLAVWLRLSPRRKVDEVGTRDGARGSSGRGLRRRSVREPRTERVGDHRRRVIVRREAAAAAGLARRNSRLGFKSRRRAPCADPKRRPGTIIAKQPSAVAPCGSIDGVQSSVEAAD